VHLLKVNTSVVYVIQTYAVYNLYWSSQRQNDRLSYDTYFVYNHLTYDTCFVYDRLKHDTYFISLSTNID
jgi:hypothetical protein